MNADRDENRAMWILGLVFGILAVGIVVAGLFYYRNFKTHYRVEVERQLYAVAELKLGELVQYRKERLENGGLLFKNAAFTALVRRFFEKPPDEEAQHHLLDWMGKFQANYQYEQVRLLDAQGGSRLGVPGGLEPAGAATAQRASEVLRSGLVALQDFYRNESDQRVYLAVQIPILDEREADRPLGVLVLRIDPSTYLYPFISRWPTPSLTAETLLIRREGNDALFLNELRFETNTALTLRVSLANTNMPAVKAALGQEGIVEGRDYRGVPAVACVRAIPDSPWFMVARMSIEEAYAPLRERLWTVIVFTGLLLIGTGAGVGVVWRQQAVHFYRERYEAAEALRASEERFKTIFNQAPLGIALIDSLTGHIHAVNPMFAQIAGRTREAMIAIDWMSITHPDDLREDLDHIALMNAGTITGFNLEKRYLRPDGSTVWINMAVTPVKVEDPTHPRHLCMIEDITARKQAEAEIKSLNTELDRRVIERTAQLEAANKELEAFSYSVSHDLRAPLRHINGYVELLVNRFRNGLAEKGRHYVDAIADSSRQMGRLIDDLLQFSRTGRAEMRQAGLDMNQALREAQAPLLEECSGRAIEWVIGALPPVCGDYAMLRLVWTNLLGNAIKYTRTRAAARIEIGAREENQENVFFVRDNGVGFDMQYAQKLFGVFRRLHPLEAFEGTGIGLATVRRIIARHGGRTWAEAELDKGATIYFTLPKAPALRQGRYHE